MRSLCAALVLLVAAAAGAKPPSWDQGIDGPGRFKVLKAFDGAAVLDKETGLVWERASVDGFVDWANAVRECTLSDIGGRLGWRLPRIEELFTLLDALGTPPPGHPFTLPPASTGARRPRRPTPARTPRSRSAC
jgi:hypothetical protein